MTRGSERVDKFTAICKQDFAAQYSEVSLTKGEKKKPRSLNVYFEH